MPGTWRTESSFRTRQQQQQHGVPESQDTPSLYSSLGEDAGRPRRPLPFILRPRQAPGERGGGVARFLDFNEGKNIQKLVELLK